MIRSWTAKNVTYHCPVGPIAEHAHGLRVHEGERVDEGVRVDERVRVDEGMRVDEGLRVDERTKQ